MDDQTLRLETMRLSRAALTQQTHGDVAATLVVLGRHTATSFTVPRHGSVIVGRGEGADVVVDDASLSRTHARFTHGEAGLVVTDLGSTNGTRVGPVGHEQPADRRALAAGDRVQLGDVDVVVLGAVGGAGAGRLVSHARMREIAADEIARARLFSRSVAVLVVRAPAGPALALDATLGALRVMDRACIASRSEIEVLLPECSADDVATIGRAITVGAQGGVSAAYWPQDGADADALFAHARTITAETAMRGRVERVVDDEPLALAPAMRAVLQMAARAASANVPVLLVGETGSGKEVVARYIHKESNKKSARTGPLVATNCGAIPLTLVESTLFGHEKGAFTGAVASQAGVLEAAHGGTVFLDEIGELPLSAQAALLRALETRTVTRVGSTKEIAVDVRIIAATHRDLDEMSKAGGFRQDLLYRMNTMTLLIPPLRERREEIPVLAQRFLDALARSGTTTASSIAADAMEALAQHAWPGNVRELKNAIERAAVLTSGASIELDDLPPSLAPRASTSAPSALEAAAGTHAGAPLADQVDAFEKQLILDALAACGGSVAEAAVRLQLPKRTLQHKMKMHRLSRKASYSS